MSDSLFSANQCWHQELDHHYQTFLESLTELNFDTMMPNWHAFKDALDAHLGFEHDHIEPLTQNWTGSTFKLIQSDHLILNRLLHRLDSALATLVTSKQARAHMVENNESDIVIQDVEKRGVVVG